MAELAVEGGPDEIATPEGDNEHLPEEPLTAEEPEVKRPRGDEPHGDLPYRKALP